MMRSTLLALTFLGVLLPLAGNRAPGTEAEAFLWTPDEMRAAAARIDELVAAGLSKQGLRPNALTGDAAFVRRAYLDIVGRIPTAAETRAFLERAGAKKRAHLIDELLASKGHVSHSFNYWADILRAKSRLSGPVSGEPFMHFIKASVAENKPYDRFVREMLTAEGAAHARGNGATGYLLRDRGMPEDNMANTVRLFLGTRLECAQCHDHPFDKWKQKEFFGMAAFSGGLLYRDDLRSEKARKIRQVGNEIRREHGAQAFQMYRRQVLRPLSQGITGTGTGLTKLPADYQYDDAKPGSFVKAETIFGEHVQVDVRMPRERRFRQRRGRRNRRADQRMLARMPQVDSRAIYARWLTSPENPRFTKVIANRMWKRAMGRGLIDPVDSMTEQSQPSNAELMAYLEDLMRQVGYDLRQFLRILYNTRTWQREASEAEVQPGEAYHFAGPVLRRMTAEQMWDSLLTLAEKDVDAGIELESPRAKAVYARYDDLANADPEAMIAQMARLGRMDNPQQAMRQERQRRRRAQRQELQPLFRDLARARRRKDKKAEERALAALEAKGVDPDRFRRRRNAGRGLARASELGSPAPAGHLVRQFGQSDRESIQGAIDDANVPQVLTLLNGFVEKQVLDRRDSALVQELRAVKGNVARIRTAYLSILSRKPTAAELALWKRDLSKDAQQGLRDLVWTLVNTHEFRFVQ